MRVANTQKLYEAGAISYMRSDAVFLAPEAVEALRACVAGYFGADALPDKPPVYKGKSGAQEAHEAVRPTDPAKSQEDLGLSGDEARLYALIRARAIASQMLPVRYTRTDWFLEAAAAPDGSGLMRFRARGRTVVDPGWHRVLPPPKGADEPPILPGVSEPYPSWERGELVAEVAESWTKAPKRYTEAGLVAELEGRGVGRPSTYAATLKKLQDRGYVFIDAKRLFVVAPFGRVVDAAVAKRFANVRNVGYTREMEERLDRVAAGELVHGPLLDEFWVALSADLDAAKADETLVAPPRPVIDGAACPKCGGAVWAWIRKGVFEAACRKRACGVEVPFEWFPKRPSRRARSGESAERAEAEEAAAEQRGAGRCPRCSGAVHRWKAPKMGVLEACGAWPVCPHLAFEQARAAKPRSAARKPAARRPRAASARR